MTGANSLLLDNGTSVSLAAADAARTLDVQNTNLNGDAIWGINTAAAGAGGGAGVYGRSSQTPFGAGVWGDNFHPNGTGVIGAGNNTGATVLLNGSGAAFNGAITGLAAFSDTVGVGEAIYTDQAGDFVRVGYWSGSLFFKINGIGTVSTHVKDPTDAAGQRRVTLHAPETPEIYFMDFGTGKLVNGRARVELDPRLLGNVAIDAAHPMRVFIQLEEDENTRGVVVKNKTATGFDVVEIQGGRSNLPFQWQVVVNRADEVLPSGRVSRNSDVRFQEAAPAAATEGDPGVGGRRKTPTP